MKDTNIHSAALNCLLVNDPQEKCDCTATAYAAILANELLPQADSKLVDVTTPGRPGKPRLVKPSELPRRKITDPVGHAALIHAIAHIEFNAINLAWDAVYRFHDMPHDYYKDWARVADEEAKHFAMLCEHLATLGYAYGDFDAHDGLWEMTQKTAHDCLVRMALVPRVLEARGLDVTPAMVTRLRDIGDERAVEILDVIFREEVGHVEIGTRWYRFLCEKRDLEPESTFRGLIKEYMRGSIRGPFEMDARLAAGFTESEMTMLSEFDTEK